MRRALLTRLKYYRNESRTFVARRYSLKMEQNILRSPYESVALPNSTVNEYFWFNMDRWPDKTAVVCGITGRGFTFSQLYRMSTSLAASLRSKLKVSDGECVAIILPNVPEYPCALLGSLQAGCIVSTFNPNYTEAEIKNQMDLSKATVAITTPENFDKVKKASMSLQKDVKILVVNVNGSLPDGAISFAEFAEDLSVDTDCLKSVRREPDDVAIIPFSSGTTGLPKGVVLTHRNIVSACKVIEDDRIMQVEPTTETHQDSFLAVLPFYHIFGLVVTMIAQMSLGCKLVSLPTFRPETFLSALVQHRTSAMFVVPPIAVFLGRHPAVTSQHLESLRSLTSGAAALAVADINALLKKKSDIRVRQGYGLTETCGVSTVATKNDTNYASVGFPVGHFSIALVKDGVCVSEKEQGELWIKGPSVMRGYLTSDGAAKEPGVDKEGWYATGDLGYYDKQGYIYITDRIKELIKVKGYQVSPAEVEHVLKGHEAVQDVAVVGSPLPDGNEEVKAFVVVKPNAKITPEQLTAHAKVSLIDFKVPSTIKFIETIPRSPAGKILKRVLRDM